MTLSERISPSSIGTRRVLGWQSAPRAAIAALPAHKRLRIGAAWRFRMEQEHLAVGHFARLVYELAATGAEPVVLALLTRAASDEVRHFAICRDYAALFVDEVLPERLEGSARPVPRPHLARREQALLEVVETCCVSETLTGLYFTEMLARTTDPFARSLVESLLEDELHHGRVGWTHLTNACREGWGKPVVEAHLLELFERAVGSVLTLSASRREGDDLSMEALAWLGNDTGARIYREGLRDMLLPGLAAVGLDVGALREAAHTRGWLP
ncbi:MAG: hypothetical protein K1X94_31975 [Sandaracinaceae bacterium]|nr:hypothetical protein [Sandaracinaceae bacterium]